MLRSGDGGAFEVVFGKCENATGEVSFKKPAEGKWKISIAVDRSSIGSGSCVTLHTSSGVERATVIPVAIAGY